MKKYITILTILVLAITAYAISNPKTLTFAWTASPTPNVSYNFYQINGTNLVLLGNTTNLTYQVLAVDVSTNNTFGVTSFDGIVESSIDTVTYGAPLPATNLHPKSSP